MKHNFSNKYSSKFLLYNIVANKKYFWGLLLTIFIVRVLSIYLFPYTSTDGPWAMSPVFSYYLGFPDYSLLAHEFLGDLFKINTPDVILGVWFQIFGITTYSFLYFGLFISMLTCFIWYYLVKNRPENQNLVYLLIISYLFSPYIHAYRPETFTIFIISLMIWSLYSINNVYFKLICSLTFAIVAGLIHHLGGLFSLILLVYYISVNRFSVRHILFFGLMGIFLTLILSDFNVISYLTLPLNVKSEVNNHFSLLTPFHILKYIIYGGPIPFLLFIHLKYKRNILLVSFVLFCFLLFCFMGRSYYLPYLFTLVLGILFFSTNFVQQPNTDLSIRSFNLTYFICFTYSAIFLFFVPFLLRILSYESDTNFRKVLDVLNNEKKNWIKTNKYFLPSQLAPEVADHKNSRLLYPFMKLNDGLQQTHNKIFYLFSSDQKKWILNNFNATNKKMYIDELVKPTKGELRISSLYKLKPNYSDSIGLWRIHFE